MPLTLHRSIAGEIRTWPGVTAVLTDERHELFLVDTIEIGLLHENRVAHLPLPPRVHALLIAAERVSPHPSLAHRGWVVRDIDGPEDAHDVRSLFWMNYYRAITRTIQPHPNAEICV